MVGRKLCLLMATCGTCNVGPLLVDDRMYSLLCVLIFFTRVPKHENLIFSFLFSLRPQLSRPNRPRQQVHPMSRLEHFLMWRPLSSRDET